MSEGDSLMGFDSNIHNEEDLYQRYPLIDLEIATSEWDPEEITVLYGDRILTEGTGPQQEK